MHYRADPFTDGHVVGQLAVAGDDSLYEGYDSLDIVVYFSFKGSLALYPILFKLWPNWPKSQSMTTACWVSLMDHDGASRQKLVGRRMFVFATGDPPKRGERRVNQHEPLRDRALSAVRENTPLFSIGAAVYGNLYLCCLLIKLTYP